MEGGRLVVLGSAVLQVAVLQPNSGGTFLLAGVPGLIFTAVVFLTLREPRKAMSAAAAAAHAPGKGHFAATLKYLARNRTFWLIAFAAAINAFIGYGHAPFVASFFFRAPLYGRTRDDSTGALDPRRERPRCGLVGLACRI